MFSSPIIIEKEATKGQDISTNPNILVLKQVQKNGVRKQRMKIQRQDK
jgi:hypothetical protein